MSDLQELKSLNSFVLFIDASRLGGGTNFFVKHLIKHYNGSVNFLVARNDGVMELSINNKHVLKKKYNDNEIISLIDKIKDNISFVFINHIIRQKKSFLDYIFSLNKKVIGITHDYRLIFKKPTFTYNDYLNGKFKTDKKLDINKLDVLITQNSGNLYIYEKYINNTLKKNIKINPIPDYTKSLQKIHTNNNQIKVGILGKISKYKGGDILQEFINKTESTGIQLFIFGRLSNSIYPHQYPYKNISELNYLLEKFQPNLLIETSICPETYSYTLTLSMLTKLPIFYIKKPIPSVIENRLKYYPKSTECIDVDDMISKIKKTKIQDYLYTIDENSFTVDKFWDSIFLKTIN